MLKCIVYNYFYTINYYFYAGVVNKYNNQRRNNIEKKEKYIISQQGKQMRNQ